MGTGERGGCEYEEIAGGGLGEFLGGGAGGF